MLSNKILAFRALLIGWMFEASYPVYSLLRPRKSPWRFPLSLLRNYPEGSLGREVAAFLDRHGLAFIANHEYHDVLHVLLGYQACAEHEVRMQWFLLGNGKRTPYLFFVVAFGSLLTPDQWRLYQLDYQAGKACPKIVQEALADEMETSLACLRERSGISAPL